MNTFTNTSQNCNFLVKLCRRCLKRQVIWTPIKKSLKSALDQNLDGQSGLRPHDEHRHLSPGWFEYFLIRPGLRTRNYRVAQVREHPGGLRIRRALNQRHKNPIYPIVTIDTTNLVCSAGSPLGLPDVSVAEFQPERVVAHEGEPVPVSFALVEPANLRRASDELLL